MRCVLVIVLICGVARAQPTGTWTNPDGTTNELECPGSDEFAPYVPIPQGCLVLRSGLWINGREYRSLIRIGEEAKRVPNLLDRIGRLTDDADDWQSRHASCETECGVEKRQLGETIKRLSHRSEPNPWLGRIVSATIALVVGAVGTWLYCHDQGC